MGTKYKGYMGDFLDIDLSTGEIKHYDIDDRDLERFIGNKGLAAKILYDNLKPGVDPLSEDNILILNTGPLNGSGAPSSSRFNASTKSPLTGIYSSSNCGGDFGIYLKKAGYDGIMLRGKADKPVYIEITDEKVEIKDAQELWGKNTEQTQELLPKKWGKVVIGPAGENLVPIACILSGERALGRTGVGAVMGSKNLKAIITNGNKKVEKHDPEGFKQAIIRWGKYLNKHPITGEQLHKYGTSGLVNGCNATNTLCHRNFKDGHWEHADEVSGETLAEKYLTKWAGCTTCNMRCERRVMFEGKEIKGPEFETVGMFGPNIENRSLPNIIRWNYLCDLYGIDTISCGSTIAFAMELTEKGKLKSKLKFGSEDGIDELLEEIAYKRGLGADIGQGSRRLAEKYGGMEYTNQCKGLEYAVYEPRGAVGHALGYATSNRGGCHLNGGYLVFFEALGPVTIDPLTPKGKPALVVFQQNLFDAVSSAGSCLFTTYAIVPGNANRAIPPHSRLAKLFSDVMIGSRFILDYQRYLPLGKLPLHLPMIHHSMAIEKLTGMKMPTGRFLDCGDRVYNMERLFSLREGLSAKDDTLPQRQLKERQIADNPRSRVPLDEMLPVYYKVRGWDKNGVPTPGKLKALGMDDLKG